ncbi:MAG: PTS sugar transporter subunit IIA [Acetobacteraceae bacterium]|nr:PTS sugar transporter subunit IIA [Acetobacteraceae bacterium]
MNISDLIEPERVILDLRARDKTHLLRELSQRVAPAVGVDPNAIFAALQARESLGSTGVGRGFALPHARIDGLQHLYGMFARLNRPMEFQAIDEHPVDLVFLLLIPQNAGQEHVGALAAIARRFRDETTVQQIRKAADADAAYRLLTAVTA